MGRPIKKSFFGNLNRGSGSVTTDDGIGGEGISSTLNLVNTGSHYSQGAVAVFSAPQLPGGVRATGSITIASPATGGGITAIALTEAGSGYTSTATVSITKPATTATTADATDNSVTLTNVTSVTGIYVGMRADAGQGMQPSNYVVSVGTDTVTLLSTMTVTTSSLTVTFSDQGGSFAAATALTSTELNAINGVAYVPGGASAVVYDIIKQEASNRYLVKTAQGTGQCKLVADSPAEGEMTIVATDTLNSTYYVTKLTAHRAVLTQKTDGGSGFEFSTGDVTGWSLDAASTGIVSIANA